MGRVRALGISADIEERLLAIVAKEGLVDRDKISLDAPLDGLGIKSADVVVILMAIEEEFGAYIPVDGALSEAKPVKDLLEALAPHLQKDSA